MAIWRRDNTRDTTCHSNAGCQLTNYLNTERPAEAGLTAPTGSDSCSDGNDMADVLKGTHRLR